VDNEPNAGGGEAEQVGRSVGLAALARAYRRRRAMRRYLQELSYEIVERQSRLESLEERIAAGRDGLYERIVSDVVQRTEVVLQELERRIGAVAGRTDQELAAVEKQLLDIAEQVAGLREARDAALTPRKTGKRGTAAKARDGRGGSERTPPAAAAE
jgi:hypothetical protein